MKKIQLLISISFCLFLFACVTNPSLPEYNAENTSGIIGIPKAFIVQSGANIAGGYYTELRVRNLDSNEFKLIKIYYASGAQIQYVNDMNPGTYMLDGFRILPVPRPDIRYSGYNTKFYSLNGKRNFQVESNQISVVPIVFRAVQESTTQGGARFNFRPFELKQDEVGHKEYETLINESNKEGQWVVNWPWTTSS